MTLPVIQGPNGSRTKPVLKVLLLMCQITDFWDLGNAFWITNLRMFEGS